MNTISQLIGNTFHSNVITENGKLGFEEANFIKKELHMDRRTILSTTNGFYFVPDGQNTA